MISQPGAADAVGPVRRRTAPAARRSAPMQLELTAERAVETQAGLTADEEPAFTQLARLAIPSGLGEQAPLIADGVDAVAISSAGERPLAAADDQLDDLATAERRRLRALDPVRDRRARRRRRRAGRARPDRPHRARPQPRPGLGARGARPGADPAGRRSSRSTRAPGRCAGGSACGPGSPGARRAACRSSARWRSSTPSCWSGWSRTRRFPSTRASTPRGRAGPSPSRSSSESPSPARSRCASAARRR